MGLETVADTRAGRVENYRDTLKHALRTRGAPPRAKGNFMRKATQQPEAGAPYGCLSWPIGPIPFSVLFLIEISYVDRPSTPSSSAEQGPDYGKQQQAVARDITRLSALKRVVK